MTGDFLADFHQNCVYLRDVTRNFEKQIHLANVSPESKVLDICCGAGYSSLKISHYVKDVIGIDVNAKSLSNAKKALNDLGIKNVQFQRGDAQSIQYSDESFDIVIARGAFRHVADYEKAIQESWRVLTPAGLLFVAELVMPSELIELWTEIDAACRRNEHYWTYNRLLRILRAQNFNPVMIIPTCFERILEEYLDEIKKSTVRESIYSKLLSLPDELKKDIYMTIGEPSKFAYDAVEMVLRKDN